VFAAPFQSWYGTSASPEQIADFERQAANTEVNREQVLLNLYLESGASKQGDVFSPWFQTWYGYAPSTAQVEDYQRQAGGDVARTRQVLTNLYRNRSAGQPPAATTPAPSVSTPTSTQPLPPTQQNVLGFLQSMDPTKGLSAYKDELWNRFGLRIQGEDKIILPDGSIYDIIINYGIPSASWGWQPVTAGGGGAAASASPQVGGVPLNIDSILGGDVWNDPSLSLLEQLSRYRMDELFQPVSDPYRDQFFTMLDERIKQLQGDPWTDSEESTLRTSATDQLQRDRQAAHEEMDRRLAALGHGKGSGTLVQAHLEVDRQFDQLVNAQQRGFDVYAIETVNQRRDQAVGLGGSAAQLSQGVREEEQARRREALTLAALFPELQNQQLKNQLP